MFWQGIVDDFDEFDRRRPILSSYGGFCAMQDFLIGQVSLALGHESLPAAVLAVALFLAGMGC